MTDHLLQHLAPRVALLEPVLIGRSRHRFRRLGSFQLALLVVLTGLRFVGAPESDPPGCSAVDVFRFRGRRIGESRSRVLLGGGCLASRASCESFRVVDIGLSYEIEDVREGIKGGSGEREKER